MKKLLVIVLALILLLSAVACGKKKELHCDGCGKICEVAADSNMEEDWTILCKECEEEAIKDNPILE